MNPLGALLTAGLMLGTLALRPAAAATCVLAAVCYLTEGQFVEIGGIRLTAMRLVLAAAAFRVLARGDAYRLRLNAMDWTLVLYATAVFLIPAWRVGTSGEFIFRAGTFVNTLTAYFVFAALLRLPRDQRRFLAAAAVLVIPIGALMALESVTAVNYFGSFGGVYAQSWIRDGHVRSAAAFANPITAGAFGATFAILLLTTIFALGASLTRVAGLLAAVAIVYFSRSSGPLMGLAVGLAAFSFWPLRRHLRAVQWALLAAIVVLHMVMKAPIWFIIGRVSDIVGGGGFHRALLIDRFVSSVDTWWLAGTSDTAHWFPYTLADGTADMTNRFVLDGVDAGMIGLLLSICLWWQAFRRTGRALRAARPGKPVTERAMWGIGVTLVTNIAILVTVTYFDQMFAVWFGILALAARADVGWRRRLARVAQKRSARQRDVSSSLPERTLIETA